MKYQKTRIKSFIGGLFIGAMLGTLMTYLIAATLFINHFGI